MRTFCVFVFLFLSVQCFISCQKQLSEDISTATGNDSLTLIKTLGEVDYDSSGVFLYQEWQTFTYDSSLNRTVVALADSDRYNPGIVRRYTATFQYDAAKRLVQYASTGGFEPAAKIDFSYNGSGDIIKTTIQDNWVGKTFDSQYSTANQNGLKIITVYDTSGNYDINGGDSRPEISKYGFDASDRLVSESLFDTYYHQPKNLYEDTFEINYYYDSRNFIYKLTDRNSYHAGPDIIPTVVSRDSALYSGGGSSIELRNSFFYVYRNMYWLTISEFGTGFANALNKRNMLSYTGMPVATAEYWTFYPPDPTVQDHQVGVFQNTFDGTGLLLKSVYPNNFGNKYGGRTEMYYTYSKVKI